MPSNLLTAGFLPLLDSVLLVLAKEKGFAAEEGLELRLIRETSWANIRDRAAIGHFDIAQMLAPMPLAASLGLTPIATPIIAPVVMGLGNNAITVSADLWSAMADQGAVADLAAGPVGAALAKVVAASSRKLRFGVVHQTSSHNYELRYWLAASGIIPDRHVEVVVLPPSLLPDALGAGSIDGYCVGEPWNSIGVANKGAHIATVKALIWQSSPDKVIGMRAQWAQERPEIVSAVVGAIYKAGLWCGNPDNHAAAVQIMSGPAYLDTDPEIVLRGLTGMLDVCRKHACSVPDFFLPHARAANFPWKSHALWYYTQMVRWGEITASPDNAQIAADCFRPDLYRAALAPLDVATPVVDQKIEGARTTLGTDPAISPSVALGPDQFFDGQVFDPDQIDAYIASQAV